MRPLTFLCFVMFCAGVSAQERFSVYFDSDQSQLAKPESARLETWMAQNPKVKIVAIHGFTDEDGSFGHNDSLAARRVASVYALIKGRLAIRDDFKTRSFGEKFPQSANKAENRKADIYYLLPKDLPRENEILGITESPKPRMPKHFPPKVQVRNPDGKTVEFKLDTIFMKKIDQAKAGEKLKIDNLNFIINTFAVTPESRGKLYELLTVMEQNPQLKIEIQGHLCCQPIDRLDLSTQRAKAVWGFLVASGIEKSRLSYKGFGSSEPIFPLPEKDESERAANRRVEILIVSN